jgi:hypothetical protein
MTKQDFFAAVRDQPEKAQDIYDAGFTELKDNLAERFAWARDAAIHGISGAMQRSYQHMPMETVLNRTPEWHLNG